jgi:hypothetical protein
MAYAPTSSGLVSKSSGNISMWRCLAASKDVHSSMHSCRPRASDYAFDCVLVWKFDRFARSTKHLLTALEEFDHLGIRFVSIQDQIDTTSPMGKAMFTLIGAMAELESSLISERVTAGMKAAKARGKHLGRPRTPAAVVARIEDSAIDLHASRVMSFWDALIVRAAVQARCVHLLTEDLQDGEHIEGLTVLDPFAREPLTSTRR